MEDKLRSGVIGNVTRRLDGAEIGPAYLGRTLNGAPRPNRCAAADIPLTNAQFVAVWPSHLQDSYIGSGLVIREPTTRRPGAVAVRHYPHAASIAAATIER
jgi:hypothetical protein